MNNIILEARHINKYFHDPVTVKVLDDINFIISKEEFVSVVGKSGCGKSTLLYILSTMDTDFEGDVLIDNESLVHKKEIELARIRNEKIGFIFQFHYLINEFTVLKNVMLPGLKLAHFTEKEIEQRAIEKLEMLDIKDLALKMANKLSGGEKQRVAIARALINNPAIIMGDEPTGNLDKKNREIVFDIFKRLANDYQQTLLIVTHDSTLAEISNRSIEMEDGKIIRQ
ncbi:ABC transporter ATP-binding protein [Ginsengibacter hankyongi]|uniref:ABC transporter ATP-binding protein n=1 Tax=Ginsengibacter hankyongi TaxID=2607284 RepID=A0A5J5IKN0_9BACT|nr:ABC transporter ATP-binding protein [Ginsengibacter hankyongi]KAA9040597.1 ABC transporter ATP-binding protein [Ginsengibacter hankyongi]